MFRGLINDAKAAAGSLVARYLARASVAVPFVVALGFATAAVTVMLAERYGFIAAAWVVAAAFTLIGMLATLIVTVKEQEEESAEAEMEKADTAGVAADAAAQAAVQAPMALLGALLSTPLGSGTVASGAKMVARNLPLVVLLALIALLFWPHEQQEGQGEETSPDEDGVPREGKPNGLHASAANGYQREAA
jgi:hypothetical protein